MCKPGLYQCPKAVVQLPTSLVSSPSDRLKSCLSLPTQAEAEEKRKDIQSLHVRIARQDADIKQLTSQYRYAQQNYERQVSHVPHLGCSLENDWYCCMASVLCEALRPATILEVLMWTPHVEGLGMHMQHSASLLCTHH